METSQVENSDRKIKPDSAPSQAELSDNRQLSRHAVSKDQYTMEAGLDANVQSLVIYQSHVLRKLAQITRNT